MAKLRKEVEDIEQSLLRYHSQAAHKEVKAITKDPNSEDTIEQEHMDITMSLELKRELVQRSKDNNELFVLADIKNLVPGMMYRFIVQAINKVGAGLASPESYSVSTLPTKPSAPSTPVQQSCTLNSITYRWSPNGDGGSALTGYRVYVKHMERHVDLNRSSVTYTLRGLQPGKQYYVRVLAKNAVGLSPYSEYNEDKDSYTSTSKPDTPEIMKAVAGTWNSLTIEALLPCCNGADITQIMVQMREIETFSTGSWTRAGEYRVPEDVLIVEEKEKEEEEEEVEEVHVEEDVAANKHDRKRQNFATFKKKVVVKNQVMSLLPTEEHKATVKKETGLMGDGDGDIMANIPTHAREEEDSIVVKVNKLIKLNIYFVLLFSLIYLLVEAKRSQNTDNNKRFEAVKSIRI